MKLRNSHDRRSLGAPDGFALVEVVVSAMLVGLISMLLVGVIAAGRTSGDQRNHSQADGLAQQDQERLRGLSIEQLTGLSQTRTVTLDGQTFTITSKGNYLTSSSSATACTATGSGSADYVSISSSVDWPANHKDNNVSNSASQIRPPVTEQSVIAPQAGGTLLTRVIDPSGNPISGARVTAVPASSSINSSGAASTDSNGCTIFAGLQPGDYTVTATKSGYTDANGDATPSSTATATGGNTATANFTLAQAGTITATFKTVLAGVTYFNQQAPSLSFQNPGMTTPPFGNEAPSAPATSITANGVFPFATSSSTNYTVWAGKCAINQTPTANQTTTMVTSGGTATPAVLMPPVILQVQLTFTYGATYTVPVKPDHIVFYQGCNSGFSTYQNWNPPVRSDAVLSNGTANPLGALSLPGQPYGSNYFICVDAYGYRAYGGIFSNNSFSGTTWPVTIDARSSSNQGTC